MDPKTDLKSQLEEVQKQQAELLSAIKAVGNKPATNNAGDLAGTASAEAQRSSGATVRPVVEVLDAYQGKGLKFARMVRAMAWAEKNRKPFDQAEKVFGLSAGALERTHEPFVHKALSEGQLAGGGVLDPDRYAGEVIEILRPKITLLAAGVVDIPMDGQSLTVGRQSGDIAGAWIGEQQDAPATAPAFDDIQLDLKKWAANVPISNDLLRDAVVAADVLVRNSLVEQAKRAMDIAMVRGVGTKFTPRGVRNAIPSTNLFSAAAGSGSNTLTTALSDLAKLQYLVDAQNVDQVKPALVFNPRYKWGLVQLRDGVGRPFFEKMLEQKMVMGVPFFDSTAVPINLSGGGSGGSVETELTYVECTQWLCGIGMMPSVEVSREAPYPDSNGTMQSAWTRDETVMRVILRMDFQPRHAGAAAVCQGNTLS
jgi:HK97 family phage major capsid protein